MSALECLKFIGKFFRTSDVEEVTYYIYQHINHCDRRGYNEKVFDVEAARESEGKEQYDRFDGQELDNFSNEHLAHCKFSLGIHDKSRDDTQKSVYDRHQESSIGELLLRHQDHAACEDHDVDQCDYDKEIHQIVFDMFFHDLHLPRDIFSECAHVLTGDDDLFAVTKFTQEPAVQRGPNGLDLHDIKDHRFGYAKEVAVL